MNWFSAMTGTAFVILIIGKRLPRDQSRMARR